MYSTFILCKWRRGIYEVLVWCATIRQRGYFLVDREPKANQFYKDKTVEIFLIKHYNRSLNASVFENLNTKIKMSMTGGETLEDQQEVWVVASSCARCEQVALSVDYRTETGKSYIFDPYNFTLMDTLTQSDRIR